jgi:hypothetical protein
VEAEEEEEDEEDGTSKTKDTTTAGATKKPTTTAAATKGKASKSPDGRKTRKVARPEPEPEPELELRKLEQAGPIKPSFLAGLQKAEEAQQVGVYYK